MRSAPIIICALAGLSACASHRAKPVVAVEVAPAVVDDEPSSDWRRVARPADIARLATLADRFAAVTPRTRAALIVNAGNPVPWPSPTPGVYRCRIHRLATNNDVRTFPPFFCYIQSDGSFLTFAKGTGTERPAGRLWPDAGDRHIFLGGAPGAAGQDVPGYGADPATDRVGIVERVADFRWRLVIDAPQPGIVFDVIEFWPDAVSLAAAAVPR